MPNAVSRHQRARHASTLYPTDAAVPVPLPVVLLAFVVAKLGIPGEGFLPAPCAEKA